MASVVFNSFKQKVLQGDVDLDLPINVALVQEQVIRQEESPCRQQRSFWTRLMMKQPLMQLISHGRHQQSRHGEQSCTEIRGQPRLHL